MMSRAVLFVAVALLAFTTVRAQEDADAKPWKVRFGVKYFNGTESSFLIQVTPKWAPLGAARFKELVKDNFWPNDRFFRVITKFVAQFGINGNPAVTKKWENKKIKDDPVVKSNLRGFISYATAGPNTRTTQLFINYVDNSFLDHQGFAPFAEVVEGMNAVDSFYMGYGEKPSQEKISTIGNSYLEKNFPKLSYITTVTME